MTTEVFNTAINYFAVLFVGLLISSVVYVATQSLRRGRTIINLNPALLDVVKHFSRYAALAVEELDKSGLLQPLLQEGKSKGIQKMDKAVNDAVGMIENFASVLLKAPIDIDENQLKVMVRNAAQQYIWENKALFPSGKSIE